MASRNPSSSPSSLAWLCSIRPTRSPSCFMSSRSRDSSLSYDRHRRRSAWLRRLIDDALNREFPSSPEADALLTGWRPHHLATGAWGSIYLGDTSILPPELVGARIIVQSKAGQSWTTTVTAVLERSSEQVVVTNSGRPK